MPWKYQVCVHGSFHDSFHVIYKSDIHGSSRGSFHVLPCTSTGASKIRTVLRSTSIHFRVEASIYLRLLPSTYFMETFT